MQVFVESVANAGVRDVLCARFCDVQLGVVHPVGVDLSRDIALTSIEAKCEPGQINFFHRLNINFKSLLFRLNRSGFVGLKPGSPIRERRRLLGLEIALKSSS